MIAPSQLSSLLSLLSPACTAAQNDFMDNQHSNKRVATAIARAQANVLEGMALSAAAVGTAAAAAAVSTGADMLSFGPSLHQQPPPPPEVSAYAECTFSLLT